MASSSGDPHESDAGCWPLIAGFSDRAPWRMVSICPSDSGGKGRARRPCRAADCCVFAARKGRLALPKKLPFGTLLKYDKLSQFIRRSPIEACGHQPWLKHGPFASAATGGRQSVGAAEHPVPRLSRMGGRKGLRPSSLPHCLRRQQVGHRPTPLFSQIVTAPISRDFPPLTEPARRRHVSFQNRSISGGDGARQSPGFCEYC